MPSSEDVIDACLELEEIKKLPGRGLIICAAGPSGSGFDFFSRFFAPNFGIDEVIISLSLFRFPSDKAHALNLPVAYLHCTRWNVCKAFCSDCIT